MIETTLVRYVKIARRCGYYIVLVGHVLDA